MLAALRSAWKGLVVFERYGHVFVVVNIVAAFLALPVVTLPIVWAGLARLARAAHDGPTCHIDDFWSGFRTYFWDGLVISAITFGLGCVLYVNYTVYALQSGYLFTLLRAIWLTVFIVWMCTLFYLFPLMERMERPTLWVGLRNALLMTIKRGGTTLITLIIAGVVLLLSSTLVVPIALISLSLLASVATAAVDDRLADDPPQAVGV